MPLPLTTYTLHRPLLEKTSSIWGTLAILIQGLDVYQMSSKWQHWATCIKTITKFKRRNKQVQNTGFANEDNGLEHSLLNNNVLGIQNNAFVRIGIFEFILFFIFLLSCLTCVK